VVKCLSTLCAVHAYKHVSPSYAIQEHLVTVVHVGLYPVRRCCTSQIYVLLLVLLSIWDYLRIAPWHPNM